MVALCKAPTKSAGIGLPITTVCKNAGKKTLGQDDFFVVHDMRKRRNSESVCSKFKCYHLTLISILEN